MTTPTRPLRIAIADDEVEIRQFLREVLTQLGHNVVVEAETGKQLVEQCRAALPDLVVTDIRMPDMSGLEAAAAVNKERQAPVVLVTAHHDADFLSAGNGHVMAYLSKPVKPVDLLAAVNLAVLRFEQFQQLQREAASLRQALEDRKVIERAKGVLMKRLQVDEEEAFRRLRKLASDQNLKLVEVSRRVVASEEVFQQLDWS